MANDQQAPNEEPNDRPFEPFRIPLAGNARTVVAEALKMLGHYETYYGLRQRARRPQDQETFEKIVAALMADLMHRALTVPEGWLAVTHSKEVLGRKNRYGSRVLSKTLPDIVKHLAAPELDFIEHSLGGQNPFVPGKNYQSTMRAGPRLLKRLRELKVHLPDLGLDRDQETIILKSKKEGPQDGSEPMDYEDNETTLRYRAQMVQINEYLASASIDYQGEDGEREVDTGNRFLRRYFSNGSFEHGGRLFGGFWQNLKKRQRAEGLLIDDESVITLDFAQMAPRILYGLAEAAPPEGDAYLVPSLEQFRDGVKKVFNALLYADQVLNRFPMGTKALFRRDITFAQVVDGIKTKHHAIAHLLNAGVGLRTMFIESEILIDILLSLRKAGVTALPVHDAVIVAASHETLVRGVMLEVFFKHTGLEGAIEREVP